MQPAIIREKDGPEAKIQRALIAFLRVRGWHVMVTHGSGYQEGFPDLYCTHPLFGQRWVEVKQPVRYSFTKAQKENFPIIHSAKVGIWILTEACESEYAKLFLKSNLWDYLK